MIKKGRKQKYKLKQPKQPFTKRFDRPIMPVSEHVGEANMMFQSYASPPTLFQQIIDNAQALRGLAPRDQQQRRVLDQVREALYATRREGRLNPMIYAANIHPNFPEFFYPATKLVLPSATRRTRLIQKPPILTPEVLPGLPMANIVG